LTFIGVYLSEQFARQLRIDNRCEVLRLWSGNCTHEKGRWVGLCAGRSNGVSKDPARKRSKALCGLESSRQFVTLEHCKQFVRLDLIDGSAADRLLQQFVRPSKFRNGSGSASFALSLLYVLSGKGTKGCTHGSLSRKTVTSFGCGWIFACGNGRARGISKLSSFGQADFWILAK
jgi:hypothetical protein